MADYVTGVIFESVAQDRTVELTVSGEGQARLVVNGTDHEWTETGYTKGVQEGDHVEVEYDPAQGYEFSSFTGEGGSFDIPDIEPTM